MKSIERAIQICKKEIEADLVLKNARVLSPFDDEVRLVDIAIDQDEIVAMGSYDSANEMDLEGAYVLPGFIDAHVHMESSMVSPAEFSKVLALHGVTTIIADPHEIANVSGLSGIQYMMDASEDILTDVFFMLPSCVPSTPFEHAGAKLLAKDLVTLKDHPRVLGLGEMMDYEGVISNEKTTIEKLEAFSDQIIDGHSPGLSGEKLAVYRSGGIQTDHECSTREEAVERIRLGMSVLIREGSAAKNADALLSLVDRDNISRFAFCTDDRHPEDLIEEGSIDHIVRIAIQKGFRMPDIIKLSSTNAAQIYGLKDRGVVSPGFRADLVVVKDLKKMDIQHVIRAGKIIVKNSEIQRDPPVHRKSAFENSVVIQALDEEKINIDLVEPFFRVIQLNPHSLLTEHTILPTEEKGSFKANNELSKLIVIERHQGKDSIGKAIVKGYSIQNGAIACTIAHDSHNLIVIGDNDRAMLTAIQRVKELGGGVVMVHDDRVAMELPLEIAGLMSYKTVHEVKNRVDEMTRFARETLGVSDAVDPIMTLAFLALPVIPKLKLTDMGLFDVENYVFVNINVGENNGESSN